VPRAPEYLKVNPRGLVPTLEFNGEIITESAIVSTFLADAFPSKLWPASTDPQGPLVRSRINFFIDAYFSKAQSHWAKVLAAKSDEEEKAAVAAYLDAVIREVEPLLADAAPFFGGSSKLTLAEVRALT
jgi:glutathione S-transferase